MASDSQESNGQFTAELFLVQKSDTRNACLDQRKRFEVVREKECPAKYTPCAEVMRNDVERRAQIHYDYVKTTTLPPALLSSMQRCASMI